MTPTEPTEKKQEQEGQQHSRLPKTPRTVKWIWGGTLTVLMVLSLVVDRGSVWAPLIQKAIDTLQLQTAPNESK